MATRTIIVPLMLYIWGTMADAVRGGGKNCNCDTIVTACSCLVIILMMLVSLGCSAMLLLVASGGSVLLLLLIGVASVVGGYPLLKNRFGHGSRRCCSTGGFCVAGGVAVVAAEVGCS